MPRRAWRRDTRLLTAVAVPATAAVRTMAAKQSGHAHGVSFHAELRYASAFALIASNSAWLIAPLSSRPLAFSISLAAPPPPFVATALT
jgi:hypothetical protein